MTATLDTYVDAPPPRVSDHDEQALALVTARDDLYALERTNVALATEGALTRESLLQTVAAWAALNARCEKFRAAFYPGALQVVTALDVVAVVITANPGASTVFVFDRERVQWS